MLWYKLQHSLLLHQTVLMSEKTDKHFISVQNFAIFNTSTFKTITILHMIYIYLKKNKIPKDLLCDNIAIHKKDPYSLIVFETIKQNIDPVQTQEEAEEVPVVTKEVI